MTPTSANHPRPYPTASPMGGIGTIVATTTIVGPCKKTTAKKAAYVRATRERNLLSTTLPLVATIATIATTSTGSLWAPVGLCSTRPSFVVAALESAKHRGRS